MFFEELPNVNYKIGNKYVEMKNIIVSINPVDEIYNDRYFDTMYINEQTPEELSYELYGDTQYHWVLLYVNKIVNPFDDWVIPNSVLYTYCVNKYGSDENTLKPKKFYNLSKMYEARGIEFEECMQYWLDNQEVPMGYDMTTYYEYEQESNDERRYIRYVPQRLLLSFIDNYQRKMSVK